MRSFAHSGKAGDVIYSLPAIRAMGGGRLILRPNAEHGFSEERAESLSALLQSVGFLSDVVVSGDAAADFDLDGFRNALPSANLADAHLSLFGLSTKERDSAWLSLPSGEQHGRIVFARSLQRTHLPGFWEAALQRFPDPVFVGHEDEYEAFIAQFGAIAYWKTTDYLELAQVIAGASLIVGNQCAPYAVAEALKIRTVQEVDTWSPNCVFPREGAFYASSERHVQQIATGEPLEPNGHSVGIACRPRIEAGPHVGQLGEATFQGCSVIVLTFNSLATIDACLASVNKTLGPSDELIVVDNNSTDGTGEWLRQFSARSNATIIFNDENLGFSSGCNVGLLKAKGRYLVILNPDTEVYPGWLEGLSARFADPHAAAVGPVSNNIAGRQFIGFHIPLESNLSKNALAMQVATRCHGRSMETKLLVGLCIMMRRDILDRVGLLDEAMFLGSEDLELSWRLRSLGYRLVIARDIFVYHRGGASFATVPSSHVSELLQESSRALVSKLHGAYPQQAEVSAMELWDVDFLSCERGGPFSS
jgi:GT2 family glycosyltransferase